MQEEFPYPGTFVVPLVFVLPACCGTLSSRGGGPTREGPCRERPLRGPGCLRAPVTCFLLLPVCSQGFFCYKKGVIYPQGQIRVDPRFLSLPACRAKAGSRGFHPRSAPYSLCERLVLFVSPVVGRVGRGSTGVPPVHRHGVRGRTPGTSS